MCSSPLTRESHPRWHGSGADIICNYFHPTMLPHTNAGVRGSQVNADSELLASFAIVNPCCRRPTFLGTALHIRFFPMPGGSGQDGGVPEPPHGLRNVIILGLAFTFIFSGAVHRQGALTRPECCCVAWKGVWALAVACPCLPFPQPACLLPPHPTPPPHTHTRFGITDYGQPSSPVRSLR